MYWYESTSNRSGTLMAVKQHWPLRSCTENETRMLALKSQRIQEVIMISRIADLPIVVRAEGMRNRNQALGDEV